jgi:hypothetical protein
VLNVQKQREAPRSAPAILFTRVLIATHFFSALLASLLLFLHGLAFPACAVCIWVLISFIVVITMAGYNQWARVLFGLLLGLGALGGLFMLIWVLPGLDKDADVILTRRVLPMWITVGSALHLAMSMCVLMSRKVHRATNKGFSLLNAQVGSVDYR